MLRLLCRFVPYSELQTARNTTVADVVSRCSIEVACEPQKGSRYGFHFMSVMLQNAGPSLRERLLKYKEASHDRLAASAKQLDESARLEYRSVLSTTTEQHLSIAGPHETQDSHLGNPEAASRHAAHSLNLLSQCSAHHVRLCWIFLMGNA